MFEFLEIFLIKQESISINILEELIIMNTKEDGSEVQQES